MPDETATEEAQDVETERAGSRALAVFARVLTARILRAHVDGPLTSRELEARLGWAAKASLRVATRNLCELGALAHFEPPSGHKTEATELTEAGRHLLGVADVLEHWLSHSPFGQVELPDTAARGSIRALVAGWNSMIIGSLAEEPRSLADLSGQIGHHSYAALKRRLSSLRSASLVAPIDGRARSPLHGATNWLRRAVGPLAVASRWEVSHARNEAPPLTRHEIEAALLLALPLVELPGDATGSCVLGAPVVSGSSADAAPALAAVSVVVDGGDIVSCAAGAEKTPSTWALGTPDAWLDAIVDGSWDALRLRGSASDIVTSLVEGLHKALFEPALDVG